ncbi:MAG: hypothetical protein AAGB22_01215 [Bacteroidota bacterium]
MYHHVSMACDFCTMYVRANAGFGQSAIGLRYRTSSYDWSSVNATSLAKQKRHGGSHGDAPPDNLREFYGSYSLWGRWAPSSRWQLTGTLRFGDNYEAEGDNKTYQVTGVGDLMVTAHYIPIRTAPGDTTTWKHALAVGGGVKLPTGVYQEESGEGDFDPLLQPGTGSVDVLFNALYLIRYNKWGWQTDVTYRRNTANGNDFRFSHRFNATGLLLYQLRWKKMVFTPSVGCYYEQAENDNNGDVPLLNTGGKVLFSQTGLEVQYSHFSVGAGWQAPLYENLYGTQGNNESRLTVELNYLF